MKYTLTLTATGTALLAGDLKARSTWFARAQKWNDLTQKTEKTAVKKEAEAAWDAGRMHLKTVTVELGSRNRTTNWPKNVTPPDLTGEPLDVQLAWELGFKLATCRKPLIASFQQAGNTEITWNAKTVPVWV